MIRVCFKSCVSSSSAVWIPYHSQKLLRLQDSLLYSVKISLHARNQLSQVTGLKPGLNKQKEIRQNLSIQSQAPNVSDILVTVIVIAILLKYLYAIHLGLGVHQCI